MRNPFTTHPNSVGETYFQHLAFATRVGGRMVLAGLACVVHGLLPFVFRTTASRTIQALHCRLSQSKRGQATGAIAKPGSDRARS